MSAAKNDPAIIVPNTRETLQFLECMFPDRMRHLVSISRNGFVNAASFAPTETLKMRDWIDERQGRDNLYYQLNGLREGVQSVKAKKSDVVAARAVHLDLDNPNAGPDLISKEPKPTAVVFSGGGYQLLWLLEEWAADLVAVERSNMAMANEVGGDKCHNIDRILRLPGTINIPNPKKRKKGRS